MRAVKPPGKRQFAGELGVDARIILTRILDKDYVRVWAGFTWIRSIFGFH
jgi:hypothetical protein